MRWVRLILHGLIFPVCFFILGVSFAFLFHPPGERVSRHTEPALAFELAQQEALEALARERVELYEGLIPRHNLLDGMLVNRRLSGEAVDQCDSLLFSSLRFVALSKLGYREQAQTSWHGISQSREGGHWLRHPSCRDAISRDMLLGLLVAFSQVQDPTSLKEVARYADQNHGYFSNGPISVSYLSPTLAEMLERLLVLRDIPMTEFSILGQLGFSTLEFDTFFARRGYQSHLIALDLWLDLELEQAYQQKGLQFGATSPAFFFADALSTLTLQELAQRRRAYLAHQLVRSDPRNLFFRWLELKTAHALGVNERNHLLGELIEMNQFPQRSLPSNCTKAADYLWQRDSSEYAPQANCRVVYHGADFTWMVALLVGN